VIQFEPRFAISHHKACGTAMNSEKPSVMAAAIPAPVARFESLTGPRTTKSSDAEAVNILSTSLDSIGGPKTFRI
jgi:hypothetical protein